MYLRETGLIFFSRSRMPRLSIGALPPSDFSVPQDQTTNEGPGFPGPLFLVPRRAKSTNGRFSRTWRRPSATTAARCFTVSLIRDSSVQVVKKLRDQDARQWHVKPINSRSDISHIPPPLPLILLIVSQEFDLACPNISPKMIGRPENFGYRF